MVLGIKNTILAVVITSAIGWAYSQYQFRQGIEIGKQQQIALQLEQDNKLTALKEELESVLVTNLSNIQLKNTVINNKTIKEVFNKEVYRECILPPEGKLLANEAIERSGVSK